MAKKILVVENSATRSLLSLEASNYELLEAHNASQGLSNALDQRPHLVLIDAELPDLNGFELCKRMRSYSELKKIPIIIFSTDNKLKNMVTAYEMGADYYIVKGDEGDRVLTLLIETIITRISRRSVSLSV
jgi:two-component system KDP operon response regulator KdpE